MDGLFPCALGGFFLACCCLRCCGSGVARRCAAVARSLAGVRGRSSQQRPAPLFPSQEATGQRLGQRAHSAVRLRSDSSLDLISLATARFRASGRGFDHRFVSARLFRIRIGQAYPYILPFTGAAAAQVAGGWIAFVVAQEMVCACRSYATQRRRAVDGRYGSGSGVGAALRCVFHARGWTRINGRHAFAGALQCRRADGRMDLTDPVAINSR